MLKELIAEIKSRNIKTKAWVAEDPKNRWAGLYPEDEAHWVERGVYHELLQRQFEMVQLQGKA